MSLAHIDRDGFPPLVVVRVLPLVGQLQRFPWADHVLDFTLGRGPIDPEGLTATPPAIRLGWWEATRYRGLAYTEWDLDWPSQRYYHRGIRLTHAGTARTLGLLWRVTITSPEKDWFDPLKADDLEERSYFPPNLPRALGDVIRPGHARAPFPARHLDCLVDALDAPSRWADVECWVPDRHPGAGHLQQLEFPDEPHLLDPRGLGLIVRWSAAGIRTLSEAQRWLLTGHEADRVEAARADGWDLALLEDWCNHLPHAFRGSLDWFRDRGFTSAAAAALHPVLEGAGGPSALPPPLLASRHRHPAAWLLAFTHWAYGHRDAAAIEASLDRFQRIAESADTAQLATVLIQIAAGEADDQEPTVDLGGAPMPDDNVLATLAVLRGVPLRALLTALAWLAPPWLQPPA